MTNGVTRKVKYRSLHKKELKYFLISEDGKFVEEVKSHWAAKRFAKKHHIPGWVVKVLGSVK